MRAAATPRATSAACTALAPMVDASTTQITDEPLLAALGFDPVTLDALCARTGWAAADMSVRLFDLEPTPIAEAQARGAASVALAPAPGSSPCAAFAEAMKIAPTSGEQVLATPDAGDAKSIHCLHVKPARGAPLFLATLYAFRDAADARDIEKQAPLFRELVLGPLRPAEFRIDAAAGWLAYSVGARSWRAVPFSVPALRGLAKAVFVAKPAGAAPWAEAGQLKLIVGDENAGTAKLPERLAAAPDQPRKTSD